MSGAINSLGFGCAGLSAQPTLGRARRLLDAALEEGITHYDTAPLYGRGYSEEILGRWGAARRDRLTYATKFGLGPARFSRISPVLALPLNWARKKTAPTVSGRPPSSEDSPALAYRRISRAEIESSFDRSRRSLRTDYIDYYLLHEALPAFLEPAAVDYLRQLKASGQVRNLGIAAGGRNYQALRPEAAAGWDVLQYEFGPAWPDNRDLPKKFPGCISIFHSCLRDYARFQAPGEEPEEVPARILADCLKANPAGKTLFSSGHVRHIRQNMKTIRRALA